MLENILRAYHCHLFKKKEPFIPGGGGEGGGGEVFLSRYLYLIIFHLHPILS